MTCEVCEQQPRGRKAAPIACMRMDPDKPPVSARFVGRGTDDTHYICEECKHEWMHEGGRDGYGWQP
jgi:hypothetical protein